jgi:hypothetical protein
VKATGARSGEFSTLKGAKVGASTYSAQYNEHTVVLGTKLSAPGNTTPPSIPPSATTGTTITCETGAWTGSPEFTFEWLRDGAPIPGQVGQTYTLTEADAGHSIICRVTGKNGAGSSQAESNALVPTPAAPANGTPSIPSSAVTGTTIKCEPGSWSGAPSFSFEWLRDGSAIAGAHAQTYTIPDGDAGHSLVCRVTATNAGGAAHALSNTLVPTLKPAPIPKGGPPPTPVAITQIASLPSAKACVSKRHFTIHLLHVKSSRIVTAAVQLNGRTVRTVKGRSLGLPIDLRGLPKGTFTVAIVTTDAHGKKRIGKRRYHTCVAGKHGHR